MTEFIASSFWKATLVLGIVATVAGIIAALVKRKNEIISVIIISVAATAICLYIWQIREGTYWLILAILSSLGLIIKLLARKIPITDESLASEVAAWTIQSTLPRYINTNMRLDSIKTQPCKKIVYSYTVLNVESGQTIPSDAKPSIRQSLIDDLKKDTSFFRFKKNDVIFVYKYMDKEQQGIVAEFEIIPSDYK